MPEEYPGSERHFTPRAKVERTDFATDGWGNRVSDIQFLLGCLDYIFEATGEAMDPEDMALIDAIKSEQR